MKKIAITAFTIAALLNFRQTGYCQNTQFEQFWDEVQIKEATNNMNGGVSSWLFEIASQISQGSFSEAHAHLESIGKDKTLQDAVFFSLYVQYQGNGESMRTVLAAMCGSYALANPVSDKIIAKYSTDSYAQSQIKEYKRQAEIEREKQEIKQKEKEAKEAKEEAIRNQQVYYTVINNRVCFYNAADYNTPTIDSLKRGDRIRSEKDSAGFVYIRYNFKKFGNADEGWVSKIDLIHDNPDGIKIVEILSKKYTGQFDGQTFELSICHVETKVLTQMNLVSGFMKCNGILKLISGMYDANTKEFKFWRTNNNEKLPIEIFVGKVDTLDKTLVGTCYNPDKKTNPSFSLKAVQQGETSMTNYEPIPITEYLPANISIPAESDYEGNWRKFRKSNETPWHVEGDFNGDGFIDNAFLLKRNAPDNGFAFFVFIAQPNGMWTSQCYKSEAYDDIHEYSLEYDGATLSLLWKKKTTNYYWNKLKGIFVEKIQ